MIRWDDAAWVAVPKFTPSAARLADDHYSRRTIGSPQFILLLVLLILGLTYAGTSPGSAQLRQPSPTSPGPASSLGASRCGSADGVSRRSPRGMPPLRVGSCGHPIVLVARSTAEGVEVQPSSVLVAGIPDLVGRSHDPHTAPVVMGRIVLAIASRQVRAVVAVVVAGVSSHAPTIYPSVDNVKPLLSGIATWYDAPSIRDAAAGPPLRIGDWRGSLVRVTAGGRSVVVVLTDVCQCPGRLIDLDDQAFAELAPLSRGVLSVVVTRLDSIPLPQTDTEETP